MCARRPRLLHTGLASRASLIQLGDPIILEHLREAPTYPKRAVVLGARGFVGSAIVERLRREGPPVLALTRQDMDLLATDATHVLTEHLRPGDALVIVSALAPCRDIPALMQNLRMVESVCAALENVELDHLVYISSDAVYTDDANPVTERSCRDPSSLHGMMHSVRELMLQTSTLPPLAILRPSLLYGAKDPHNGYGPNRFRRTAQSDGQIKLFGNGEERRDHVFIGDLAELVWLCLSKRSKGALNIATGQSASFHEVADLVAGQFESPVEILPSTRQNPITHRHFDITETLKAFPAFHYTTLAEGLARVHREILQQEV